MSNPLSTKKPPLVLDMRISCSTFKLHKLGGLFVPPPQEFDLTRLCNLDVFQLISQQVDPASATITVTAVEVEELSKAEQRDRLHLERRVERGVFEAVKALAELRDRTCGMWVKLLSPLLLQLVSWKV